MGDQKVNLAAQKQALQEREPPARNPLAGERSMPASPQVMMRATESKARQEQWEKDKASTISGGFAQQPAPYAPAVADPQTPEDWSANIRQQVGHGTAQYDAPTIYTPQSPAQQVWSELKRLTPPQLTKRDRASVFIRSTAFRDASPEDRVGMMLQYWRDNSPRFASKSNREQLNRVHRFIEDNDLNYLERFMLDIPVLRAITDPALGGPYRAYLDPEQSSAWTKSLLSAGAAISPVEGASEMPLTEIVPPWVRGVEEGVWQAGLLVGVFTASAKPAAAISAKLPWSKLPEAGKAAAEKVLSTQRGRMGVTAAAEQAANVLKPRAATRLAHWVSTRGVQEATAGELYVIGESALHMERPELHEFITTPLSFVALAGMFNVGGQFLDRFNLNPLGRRKLNDDATKLLEASVGLQKQARTARDLIEAHTERMIKQEQGKLKQAAAFTRKTLNTKQHQEARREAALEMMDLATGQLAADSAGAQRIMETLMQNPRFLGTDFGLLLARQLSPRMNTLYRNLGKDAPFTATVIQIETGKEITYRGTPGKLRKTIAEGIREGKLHLSEVSGSPSVIRRWRDDPTLVTDVKQLILDPAMVQNAAKAPLSSRIEAEPGTPTALPGQPRVAEPTAGQPTRADVGGIGGMQQVSLPASARAVHAEASIEAKGPRGATDLEPRAPSVTESPKYGPASESAGYGEGSGRASREFIEESAGYDPKELARTEYGAGMLPSQMTPLRPIASEPEKRIVTALSTPKHAEAQAAWESIERPDPKHDVFPATSGELAGAGTLEVGDTAPMWATSAKVGPPTQKNVELLASPTRDPARFRAQGPEEHLEKFVESGRLRVLGKSDPRGVLLEDTKTGIRYVSSPLANGGVANFVPALYPSKLRGSKPPTGWTEATRDIAMQGTAPGTQKSPGLPWHPTGKPAPRDMDTAQVLQGVREYLTSGKAIISFPETALAPSQGPNAGTLVRVTPFHGGKVLHLLDDTTGQHITMLTDDIMKYVQAGQATPFTQGLGRGSRRRLTRHPSNPGLNMEINPTTRRARGIDNWAARLLGTSPQPNMPGLARASNRKWQRLVAGGKPRGPTANLEKFEQDAQAFLEVQAVIGERLGLSHQQTLPDATRQAMLHMHEIMSPQGATSGTKLLQAPNFRQALESKAFKRAPSRPTNPTEMLANSLDIEVRYNTKGQVMLVQKVGSTKLPFLHKDKEAAFRTLQHMRQQRMEHARLMQRQFMDDWTAQPVATNVRRIAAFEYDMELHDPQTGPAWHEASKKVRQSRPGKPSLKWGAEDHINRFIRSGISASAHRLGTFGAMKVQSTFMRMGKWGNEIAGMFRDAADLRELTTGRYLKEIDGIFKGLTEEELKVGVYRHMELGEPARFEVQEAARALRRIVDELHGQAERLGIPGLKPMIQNYFPHVFDMVKYATDKGFKEKLIQQYAKTLAPQLAKGDPVAAARQIVAEKLEQAGRYKSAHLMDDRLGLPGFTTDAREAFYATISRNARMLAEHRVYGNPAMAKARGWDQQSTPRGIHQRMYDAIGQLENDQWRAYARDVFIEETKGFGLAEMSSAWIELYNWQKMKLTYSGIVNVSQGLNTIQRVGIRAFVKGFKDATKEGWHDSAREVGALSYGMLADHGRDGLNVYGLDMETVNRQYQGILGKTANIKHKMEDIATLGIRHTEIMNRGVAVQAGYQHFDLASATLLAERGNPLGKKFLAVSRDLQDLGLNTNKLLQWNDVANAGGKGAGKALQHLDVARRLTGKRVSDLTQFRGGAQHLPKWARTGAGRMVFQFKTFTVNQASFMTDELIGTHLRGQHARGFRALAMFLSMYPAAGLATGETKHWLTYELPAVLRGERSKHKSQGVKAWNKLQETNGADKMFAMLNLWAVGTIQVGSLGVLGDLASAHAYYGEDALGHMATPVMFSTPGNALHAAIEATTAALFEDESWGDIAGDLARKLAEEGGGAGRTLGQAFNPRPGTVEE